MMGFCWAICLFSCPPEPELAASAAPVVKSQGNKQNLPTDEEAEHEKADFEELRKSFYKG